MAYLLNWHMIIVCIFIQMIMIRSLLSQLPMTNCSLDFQSSSSWYNSSCSSGDWNGFVDKRCCAPGFNRYLYALAQRANKTGLMYLNPEEHRTCLAAMEDVGGNVSTCGLEKLTSGVGGCSDYLVADVNDAFTVQLNNLKENCRLEGSDQEWDQSCGSCLKSWWGSRELHPGPFGAKNSKIENAYESSKIEHHVCRFAVLVALTSSRIGDAVYVQRLYNCLWEQNIKAVADSSSNQAPAGGPSQKQAPVRDESPPEKKGKKVKYDEEILMPIAAIIGVALVLSIGLTIVNRNRKKDLLPEKNAFKDLQQKKFRCPRFPFKEVNEATKNLHPKNFIGEGTAGKVYKGIMSNNQPVAVKHIINDGSVETVVREVMNLSHVRHPNLVALLGYCVRQDECFLIYELCPNGNLSQWIFGKNKTLSWIQRLQISIDSARGLWFLHTYLEGCIVHRDIKPSNILLGPNFEAKLSDFGLSKVINIGETYASSEVRGTFGYVDPEYQDNRQVNSSGDVYSFGIVLLQIISGKRVVNMNMKRPVLLDKMAKSFNRGGSLTQFADPKLEQEYSEEAFILTFQLALSCAGLKQQRPSMEQVVLKLEEALNISTRAKSYSPLAAQSRLSS